MAFTSGISEAGTDDGHGIELQVNGHIRSLPLYNRAGDDASKNKGDLWEFSMSSFGFPNSCITIEDIEAVSIVERSNDGWNIASIMTVVEDMLGGFKLLTRDFDVNRWIDGNHDDLSRRSFKLTFN